jgi:hypothetical protein
MSSEKLVELMNSGRLIAASDNVIYPLIQKKIQDRLNLACSKFVGGEKDFIADLAYIQGLKEIELELKKLQKAGNEAYAKLNEET